MDAFAVYESLIALGWDDAGEEPCVLNGVLTQGPASQHGYLHAKKHEVIWGRPVISKWAGSTTAGIDFPENFPRMLNDKHESIKLARRKL